MKLSKLEAAKQQLEVACRLFVSGESLLAIHTLSGAAEEILGKLAERAAQKNMFQRMHGAAEELTGKRMSYGELSAMVNGSRNALKHATNPDEDPFTYDPDHAVVMLFRAMVNYQLVTGSLSDVMEEAVVILRQSHPGFFVPTPSSDVPA